MLTGLVKADVGPALEGQLEIHARRREVHERAAVIERQVLLRPAAEFLELARIPAVDPAGGVADVDRAVIVKPDDVAGISLLRLGALRGHERERIGDAHFLAEARVIQTHPARVLSRAQAQERDAVAMRRIHIRLDLEYKPR